MQLCRWTILISCLVLMPAIRPAVGQTDSLPQNAARHALLFQIGENLSLRSFEGATLSFKHKRSVNTAFRIGIAISAERQKDNVHADLPDSIWRYYRDALTSMANVHLHVSIQRSRPYSKRVSFYVGYGLHLGFNHLANTSTPEYRHNYNSFTIGPMGYAGVEWLFHPMMSLSGEYGLSGYYTYTISNMDAYYYGEKVGTYKIRGHSFGLRSPGPKLGLSTYF